MRGTQPQELARKFLDLWLKQGREVVQDHALYAHGIDMLRGFAANASSYSAPPNSAHFALPPNLMPLHFSMQSLYWQNLLSALAAGSCARADEDGRFSTGDSTTLFALMRRMAEDPEFAACVRTEIHHRLQAHMQTMQAYYQARYERTLLEPECIWQQGECRLLCYAPSGRKKKHAVLLVPSLINRYHILDLSESNSFARHLAAQGHPVFLVDWGLPGDAEKRFTCETYVTSYLCAIGEKLQAEGHTRIVVAGHCMGGMLTLAFAAIRPDVVSAIALLATPWDFSADPLHPVMRNESGLDILERYIEAYELLPGEHILAMFYLRDPWLFQEKLEHFHDLEPGSEAYERFLAIEHWVNGCVPLARGVARDGFIHWGAHNQAYHGQWRVGGRLIVPAEIQQPALVATPRKDRIVPYAAALPLANALPNAIHLTPDTGHVGMIVGSHAKEQLWEPFAAWMKTLA